MSKTFVKVILLHFFFSCIAVSEEVARKDVIAHELARMNVAVVYDFDKTDGKKGLSDMDEISSLGSSKWLFLPVEDGGKTEFPYYLLKVKSLRSILGEAKVQQVVGDLFSGFNDFGEQVHERPFGPKSMLLLWQISDDRSLITWENVEGLVNARGTVAVTPPVWKVYFPQVDPDFSTNIIRIENVKEKKWTMLECPNEK